eukprot:CAMPEP_0114630098 /NCGR_PEP_ID=MMETSP0168-20121206/13707_1 /TAXON_ID=95228 ORGANISM="Vannella sp., Strain DIVA3 517/6/12" /NCGR_SAMPLE_ID=MMETSP0168 /ASSEMBLY_ACC=CAM_ASM_000044 /LENGTH=224 /DNA_ID=CAMNT_0001841593 /DNA_START=106 /DNA_END=780 /DNA_ORIENTATION=-
MSLLNDISQLRPSYDHGKCQLTTSTVQEDPVAQFKAWLQESLDAGVKQANAMTLATCTKDGTPSARMVLMKGVDERGFQFFTNYLSQKGKELEENPKAALVFFWEPLHRQVRVEGTVSRVPSEESDEYFATRPRGSQINSAASLQSQEYVDKEEVREKISALETQCTGPNGEEQPVPRPSRWGGFNVTPSKIEFWQGDTNRLHDRVVYRRGDPSQPWSLTMLYP